MALNYEMEALEDFITGELHPKKQLLNDLSVSQITVWEEFISAETKRIKKQIKSITEQPINDRNKEWYIQRIQQDTIILKNILVQYLLPKTVHDLHLKETDLPLVQIYKTAFWQLKELVEYIETYFFYFFNLDEQVPESYLMRSQDYLKQRLKNLAKKLSEIEYDKMLIAYVNAPIHQLCSTNDLVVSYRHFLYIKKLLTELEELEGKASSSPLFTPLQELLFYLNFNSSKVSQRLIEGIVNKINTLQDQTERVGWLLEYQKALNQLQIKPGMKLVPAAIGLKEQIAGWVEEEFYYLKKKEALFSVVPETSHVIVDEDKLHFGVAEPVLSVITRSALDTNFILNKVKKGVYETLASISTTKGSKNPKPGALQKKGYDPERSHKDEAIGVLHSMIRSIMKY